MCYYDFMQEIETKVLEINKEEIIRKLEDLGAEKIQDVLLKVDWFSPADLVKDNHPSYLRLRSYSSGKVEVTWKGKMKISDGARQVEEVNVLVADYETTKLLFEALGYVYYAHQEKKRMSWRLGDVQFDMDTYPGVPTFLEIEASSGEEIKKMIEKLNLENFETWNEGERTLIENKYKLKWSDMHF